MSETQKIAEAYRAVTMQGAWYGPTVAELLVKISAEEATKRPVPGAHSISELLQHLLLWNERVRKTAEGQPMPKWEAEKEWAEAPIAWNELVMRWKQSRDLLEEKIRNFRDADLGKQVPGRGYAYEELFPGIVQHTIYHSGQIAMVLSMVRRAR
ncbi:MAG TPA: DinB family protein [Terriglobales bacterium]|nr:DinB family protein [Terriglobales bacterium]